MMRIMEDTGQKNDNISYLTFKKTEKEDVIENNKRHVKNLSIIAKDIELVKDIIESYK